MMDVYVFNADLYCAGCGEGIRARLDVKGKRPENVDDESSYDSDDYPKGPYPNGGGESDAPQHCGRCHVFLENPLTSDGQKYLTELLVGSQGSRSATQKQWCEFYGRNPEAPYFDKYGYFVGELPEECVRDCTQIGEVSKNVWHWCQRLRFRVPRQQAIEYLYGFGAWSDLNTWSDIDLAEMVLWLACGDVVDARHQGDAQESAWIGLVH